MYSVRSSRQSICLRCQFRSALQQLAQARRRGSRPFTSTNKLRNDDAYEPLPDEGADTPSLRRRSLQEGRSVHKRWDQGKDRSVTGSSKSAGFYRIRLNQNAINLDIDALGKPASILRFDVTAKNARSRSQPHSATEDGASADQAQESTQQLQDISILSELELQKSKLSDAEIVPAVEAVKDNWLASMDPQAVPSAEQCWDVYQRLKNSFSIQQLQHYLQETQTYDAEDFDDLQGHFESALCARSAWSRDVDSSVTTNHAVSRKKQQPSLLQDYAIASGKQEGRSARTPGSKLSTVEHILRRSWRLRTLEEMQAIGSVNVRLQPEHCSLLEQHDLFRQLERRLDVNIALNDARDTLQITGLHSNCTQAFIAIYAPLSTITVQRLDLGSGPFHSHLWKLLDPFKSGLIAEIANFAKVAIREVRDKDRSKSVALDIMFFAPDDPGGLGSDMRGFDTVTRILRDILSDASVDQPCIVNGEVETAQAVPLEVTPNLPVHLRSRSWVRYENISEQSQPAAGKVSLEDQRRIKDILRLSCKAIQGVEAHERSTSFDFALNPSWDTDSTRVTRLETGKIAFAKGPGQHGGLRKLGRNVFEKSGPLQLRGFAPSVTGGISALERIADQTPQLEEEIVLKFLIEDFADGTPNHRLRKGNLPNLEVSLRPDESGKGFKLGGAKLSLEHSSCYLMQPAETMDAVVGVSSNLNASSSPDTRLLAWTEQISGYDGHVDERSIPPILSIDVPLVATTRRSAFLEKASSILRPADVTGGVPPAFPDDTRMKRARSSDLLGDNSGDEYYKYVSQYRSDEQPDLDEMQDSKRAVHAAQDVRADDDLDLEFDGLRTNDDDSDPMLRDDSREQAKYNFSRKIFRTDLETDASSIFTADKLYKTPGLQSNSRVDYRFAALEYRSHLHTTYQGYALTYSIIDAGDLGGRGEKLVLEAPNLKDRPGTESPANVNLESKIKERVRDRIIRGNAELRQFEGQRDLHKMAEWLETGLDMIRELK